MSHPDVALRNDIHSKRGLRFVDRWLLQQIFKQVGPAPLRLSFKDGEEMSPPGVSPVATIVIRELPNARFANEVQRLLGSRLHPVDKRLPRP